MMSSRQVAARTDPEIVIEKGNLILRAGSLRSVDIEVDTGGEARVNGQPILTAADLVNLQVFQAGMAGATLGPDVALSLSFESPVGSPDAQATAVPIDGAWDGLLTDRTPYTALPVYIATLLGREELCGSGGSGLLIVRYTHPLSGQDMVHTTQVAVSTERSTCLSAKEVLFHVFDFMPLASFCPPINCSTVEIKRCLWRATLML